jgi:hypothetical protein
LRRLAFRLHGFDSCRELSFRKGDVILVHKKLTENWYLGEHHGFFGMFPVDHVRLLNSKTTQAELNTIKNEILSKEGLARAKYDFLPQAGGELELHKVILKAMPYKASPYRYLNSLTAKGDLVSVVRRVDTNWYEGYIGRQRGIFPVQYVEFIREPKETSECQIVGHR